MPNKIDITSGLFCDNIIVQTDEDFIGHTETFLTNYAAYLQSIGCSSSTILNVKEFNKHILLCLYNYFEGYRDNAFSCFSRAIERISFDKMVMTMPMGNYYRVRTPREKQTGLYRPDEMFHIAFQNRYRVKVQRYSYPGYPCLYLGSTVEVCCDEVDSREDNLNVAEFQLTSDNFHLLDMCFFENYDFQNLTEEQYSTFLQLWPLVKLCSFRYKNVEEMSFRPDYVIPQMLLEYIVVKSLKENMFKPENSRIVGIRYCSVRYLAERFRKRDFAEYMNYVLPVQEMSPTGFCRYLEAAFRNVGITSYADYKATKA